MKDSLADIILGAGQLGQTRIKILQSVRNFKE